MKVLLFLLMILPFWGCVNSMASAGHILKGNAEDDAKNFLNINDRTSALRFTDGERIMLPCFSGENNTELYVVYFLVARRKNEVSGMYIIRKDIGRAKMPNRRTDMKKTWNAISMRE